MMWKRHWSRHEGTPPLSTELNDLPVVSLLASDAASMPSLPWWLMCQCLEPPNLKELPGSTRVHGDPYGIPAWACT